MTSTPTMCHQAEIELRRPVIWTRKMLISTAISITPEYVTKIQLTVSG